MSGRIRRNKWCLNNEREERRRCYNLLNLIEEAEEIEYRPTTYATFTYRHNQILDSNSKKIKKKGVGGHRTLSKLFEQQISSYRAIRKSSFK
ncbi:hypothetical protein A3Q56_06549 [Intoshia linei]|uniref:Uncharacterized protein n=1 Tax=Intoshia linei TaxID=1819745 RepID=A0A177AWI5_9BILA|nr:hypothetical protein A3Q56_06549 [Intoshia linei]